MPQTATECYYRPHRQARMNKIENGYIVTAAFVIDHPEVKDPDGRLAVSRYEDWQDRNYCFSDLDEATSFMAAYFQKSAEELHLK